MQPAIRILISALLIYAISELSKRDSFWGALLASLPLVSILAMMWLWRATHDPVQIARFASGVFWLVIPSLLLFALLPPLLLRLHLSFTVALLIGCAVTGSAYVLLVAVLKRFGMTL